MKPSCRPGERRDPYRGIYRCGVVADVFTKLMAVVMGPCFRRDDIERGLNIALELLTSAGMRGTRT